MTVTGKPDVGVFCARDAQAWVAQTDGRPWVLGQTHIVERETYLPLRVCRTLENRLRGRKVHTRTLAYHLFVFGHESEHLRGWEDERTADCLALRRFAATARAFGVERAKRVRTLRRMLAARGICS